MSNNLSYVCEKDMCAGCGLCINTCPVNAITIVDSLKSLNAVINTTKCVKCNRCHNDCPQNTNFVYTEPIKWFQGWIDDEQDRVLSSSGGVGYALAKSVIKKGGYVVSCLLREGEFTFKLVDSENELSGFRGSKYVKSNPTKIYAHIKKKLEEGKTVLFLGLPCQVAGIKKYIGENLGINLITVDLICHGSPSQELLRKFLEQYGIDLRKLNNLSFREKQFFSINADNATICPKQIKDRYTLSFVNGLTYTENCYSCHYAQLGRISDLTIGDSWGTDFLEEEKKGVSLILCQNKKGITLVKSSPIITKQVDLKHAINNNKQLMKPSEVPLKRDDFFKQVSKGQKFNRAVFSSMRNECIKQEVKKLLLPVLKWFFKSKY